MQFKRDLQEAKIIEESPEDDSSFIEAEEQKQYSVGRVSVSSQISQILSQATSCLAKKIRSQKIEFHSPYYEFSAEL